MSTEIYLPAAPESVVHTHGVTENARRISSLRNKSKFPPLDASAEIDLSPWCDSASKRVFDLACVIPALIGLAPFLALIALAIRITSSGPIIFRQRRVGQHRVLFTIYKFRTMVANSESMGPEHTANDDSRITPLGRFLRRFKLDELPQLYNVIRGDMSLVGPRPKLPNHEITSMSCRPGITGAATLAFRREQHVLREIPVDQVRTFYSQYIAPTKVRIDAAYMESATFVSDFSVLCKTVFGGGQQLVLENLVSRAAYDMQDPIVLDVNRA